MMRFGYEMTNMMNWGYGGSLLAGLTWVVWLVVGVLAIVWLWKQIQK